MMGIIHSSRPSRARTHREPIAHITTVAIAVADAVAIAVARRLMWDLGGIFSIDQSTNRDSSTQSLRGRKTT